MTIFKKYIDENIVNIIQPDILYLGGIEEQRVAKYASKKNMILHHMTNMF